MHHQENGKLAERGGHGKKFHILVSYAYDKICHHRYAGEEDRARHALSVEHEEEREIDKGGARLLLGDDEKHGQEDDSGCHGEVARLAQRETVGGHQPRGGKSRCKLGELRRLKTQRAKHKPRAGTLDLVRVEHRGEEQDDEGGIDEEGESGIEAVVHHENDESETHRRAYPYYLHS